MRSLARWSATAAVSAIALVAGGAALAQSIRIGGAGDPNTGNGFPFGSSFGTRYQQVYNAALFPGPMTIAEIDFFNNNRYPGVYPANGGMFTISLSTTSAAVNALSSVMADNLGGDNTVFFVGLLDSTVPIVDGEYTMQLFGGPFTYDPSAGNLLMDVQVTGGSYSGLLLDARNGTFGTDSSRMHDYGTAFSSYGLVTQFKGPGDAVPEAGTGLLLGSLLGSAVLWRRGRRAR